MKKKGIIIIAVVVVILLCLLWAFLYAKNIGNQEETEKPKSYVIVEANKDNFEKEVLQSNEKVLVCFYAKNSQESEKMIKILIELVKEKQDIKIVTVTNEQTELMLRYNIQINPTLVVIEKGQEIDRTTNASEKQDVLNLIK